MNAAAIKMLADKGFTTAEMVEFAQLLEGEGARSKAAARQARYRQRRQESVTNNVTSDATNDVTSDVTNPPKSISTPLSVAEATGADAPDPIKELFDVGVSVLKASGHDERSARSIIGKWRKGHDDGEVLAALVDCRTKAISNPIEWMPKRLGRMNGQRDHADIVLEETERRPRIAATG